MTIDSALRDAAAAITASPSLAITGHVSPDGDALGSSLALAHAARRAGKEAVVSFGSPFAIADTLSFLDLSPVVPPNEFPKVPECMVVFDCGSADRLAELGSPAKAAKTLIVVDHHVTQSDFGDIKIVDSSAAASAQLATDLLDALGWEIDPVVAQCLLTGLVTDTGRFQYSATSGDVMRLAGRLVDAGAVPDTIGQHVYGSVPFGYLAVSAAVLGRAVLEEDLGFIWSVVEADDVKAAQVGTSDLDGLIDDLRIAREAGVALLLKQTDAGWKASMRSRGAVDVGSIAESFGGGGHHNAAGFNAVSDPKAIVESIREQLRA